MHVHEVDVLRPGASRPTRYNVKGPNPDFVYVTPTAAELSAYCETHGGRQPAVNAKRAVCLYCSQRIWAAGIALGTHVHVEGGQPTTPAAVKGLHETGTVVRDETAERMAKQESYMLRLREEQRRTHT